MRNDNVIGLDRLAKHQAAAYHTWLRRLAEISRQMGGTSPSDRSLTPGHTGNLLVVGSERRAA
jgi:hypothetical protein